MAAPRQRTTMTLAVLRESGTKFKVLEGWCTITHLARLLGVSYQGAQYQVFDAMVFHLSRDLRLVNGKTVLIREAAAREYVESRGRTYRPESPEDWEN